MECKIIFYFDFTIISWWRKLHSPNGRVIENLHSPDTFHTRLGERRVLMSNTGTMGFITNNSPSLQKSNYTKIEKKKEHMKFHKVKNQGKLLGHHTNLLEQQCQHTQLLAQCTDQKPRLYNTKDRCKYSTGIYTLQNKWLKLK